MGIAKLKNISMPVPQWTARTDKPEVLVRMLYRDQPGDLDSNREDYTVEQYGSTIPNVGDIIVSQMMKSPDANSLDPGERTFCEVVRRYFLPDDQLVRVVIEVKHRPGKWGERGVL